MTLQVQHTLKMVIVKYGEKSACMDGYLKTNLDLYQKMVKKKRDLIFVTSGREGEGKTYLTAGILKYLDPTFNLDRCYFNGEDFVNGIIAAREPFKAYMFDEGQEFTSRAAMSRFNKLLVQVLSKVRAKQLYIGICIPSFFELDKYAAIHRSNFLLNVYSVKGQRGQFKFWNWEKKKNLYLLGKKSYDFNLIKPNFRGRFFTNSFPFLESEYEEKKFASIENIEVNTMEQRSKQKNQRDALIRYLINVVGLKQIEVSNILNEAGYSLTRQSIAEVLRNKVNVGDSEHI